MLGHSAIFFSELLKQEGYDIDETQSEEYKTMIAEKTKALYSYYYSLGEDALKELQRDRDYVEGNIGASGYNSLLRYFS